MAVDREKILQAAQKLVDKKRFDKAIEEYKKLVADDPGDVRTLLKIGDLQSKLERFEEAIGTYEQVGEYYFREGFAVKAIAVYKQIRGLINRHCPHLENKYGHIVPRLAEIYTQLGLTSDALAAYDEVATRMRQEGRERDALDVFKKVVELDPQNPIAHLRVADSRARLGDIDKAVDAFGEAARIMVKLNRQDDAIKVLERLLEYRQDAEHARMCGLLYLERGQPHDGMTALAKLQLAFKANPKDLETLGALARAFDTINQPKKAIEVLKESARIARDTGDGAEFRRLAELLQRRAPDDHQVAQLAAQSKTAAMAQPQPSAEPELVEDAESIDEVVELGEADLRPSEVDLIAYQPDARALVQQAEALRLAGRGAEAIQLLRSQAASQTGAVGIELRMKLADLLLEAGDQRGASAEKLILARELAQLGWRDRAVQVLDEVLLLHPGHPAARQLRAELGYHDAGAAPPSAVDPFATMPLDAPLQSYDVESGGVDDALRGAQTGPHRAASLEMALEEAELLADMGRVDEARAILTAQLKASPNHPLLLDRLADLDQPAPTSLYPEPRPSQRGDLPVVEHSWPGYDAQLVPQPGYPAAPEPQSDPYARPSDPYARPSYVPTSGARPSSAGYSAPSYEAPSHEAPSYEAPPYEAPSYQQAAQQPSHGYYAEPSPAPHAHAPSFAAAPPMAAIAPAPPSAHVMLGTEIADDDAATHYELGVAYMEMGNYGDAISELSLAAHDAQRECVCLVMIATIYLQSGDAQPALDALHRALNAPQKTPEQELALGYEIGHAYESTGNVEQALRYFEWLAQLDPNYTEQRGSVAERIHRIRAGSGPQPRPGAVAYPPAAARPERKR